MQNSHTNEKTRMEDNSLDAFREEFMLILRGDLNTARSIIVMNGKESLRHSSSLIGYERFAISRKITLQKTPNSPRAQLFMTFMVAATLHLVFKKIQCIWGPKMKSISMG